ADSRCCGAPSRPTRLDVEHERINVRPQFSNDERNLLRHQPADEMHVTAQPVQLGDDDRTLAPPGLGQRGGELRPTLQRVGPLAGPTSVNSAVMAKPSWLANCAFAARCASRPRPERPCFLRGNADVGSTHLGQAYERES